MEERQPYGQIKVHIMTSVNGMLGPGSLTLETIQQVKPKDSTSKQKSNCLESDRLLVLPC